MGDQEKRAVWNSHLRKWIFPEQGESDQGSDEDLVDRSVEDLLFALAYARNEPSPEHLAKWLKKWIKFIQVSPDLEVSVEVIFNPEQPDNIHLPYQSDFKLAANAARNEP